MARLNFASGENLFFTADTHFGLAIVIKYCGRPYATAKEMTTKIIETWNATISDLDTVFHLGDFSFLNQTLTREILEQLNGNIILVRGNHDSSKIVQLFSDVLYLVELHVKEDAVDQMVTLCHYPLAVWPSAHYGAWHLHGHSHNSYHVEAGKILDVGWDVWGRPISYKEVKEYMATRSLTTVDHHSAKEPR